MHAGESNSRSDPVLLSDRWEVDCGRIVISGTQAIVRILLDQAKLDRSRGLATAGYVSGYRGSPLGTVDNALWSVADRLRAANVVFQPGVNEDIAATAVRGTQQFDVVPGPRFDGVFAAWYGKGPGVDRSGDAFKHGNYAGAHRNGGVILFYGDDHAAKSSTVAHHSEQAVSAALIPSLYPSSVEEIWRFGLLGYALSRYSGSWVAMKCVTEVVEQTATVDINLPGFAPVVPPIAPERAALAGLHAHQGKFDPLGEERIVVEERLPLVREFVRANRIDRTDFRAATPRIGIVTAGKTFGDVHAALELLGMGGAEREAAGLSLYKVGCIWPLEPEELRSFANGHEALFVVEEKMPFLEPQIASVLVNVPDGPALIGKRDEAGQVLLSSVQPLDSIAIADALRKVLGRYCGANFAASAPGAVARPEPLAEKRSPYFCSGCPHNRSTRLPDGSFSMTGIGCHTMVNFARPEEAFLPTQMGGEGANWFGIAPFTETGHIFQNMGDGTYYHSGLLAIRAAVASGTNITYKILYNDAVAMTGGQPVDGPISVAEIAQQVLHEGVTAIVVLSDDPGQHRGNPAFPPGVTIGHRDELDAVQHMLRETVGCSVLIYEQTCAAEKRRRRKRGQMPDPPKRLFIAKSVCEGCGDCSEVSTCVSLVPVETAFGRKRAIDQSSCNKDYSCINGFCPSFITVHDAAPRRTVRGRLDESLWDRIPAAPVAPIRASSFNLMIAGIGGTGVVTVGAVIGMAAHIDGLAMATFDMTGVSQKNGAVFSHVKIARQPGAITSSRLGQGEADCLLAFDLVAALAPESIVSAAPSRTHAIANTHVTQSFEFQFDRDRRLDVGGMMARLSRRTAPDSVIALDARQVAEAVLGDTIAANMFLVGIAAQSGLLPVGTAALEEAIRLNNVAVDFNLDAFRLGRLYVADPAAVEALIGAREPAGVPLTLDEVVRHRAAHLVRYDGPALAERYRAVVERVRQLDAGVAADERLALAVARNFAKLLSYKDEYEVARLLTDPELAAELERTFENGGRIAYNLAPPLLSLFGKGLGGRPKKRSFPGWTRAVLRAVARLKVLRGSWIDPFGWTGERREERALIGEYEALVGRVLGWLDCGGREAAIAVLELADGIRGFGPVKAVAIARYRRDLAEALAAFERGGRAPRAPEPGEGGIALSPALSSVEVAL